MKRKKNKKSSRKILQDCIPYEFSKLNTNIYNYVTRDADFTANLFAKQFEAVPLQYEGPFYITFPEDWA